MSKTFNTKRNWTPFNQVLPTGQPSSLPFASQAGRLSYCKRCGRPLLYCGTDEDGKTNYTLEEEMSLSVCHSCYSVELKAIQDNLIKIAAEMQKETELSEEEKMQADSKYEDAIKKYMEGLSSKNGNNDSTDI